jgi:Mrp family chromosome partitioning ATPase
MSILDRAIVKAFQRRRDSEAVTKTVAVEPSAAQPAPAPRATATPKPDKYLYPQYPTESIDLPLATAFTAVNQAAATVEHSAASSVYDSFASQPVPDYSGRSGAAQAEVDHTDSAVAVMESPAAATTQLEPQELPASVVQPERPVAHPWKWPEICEQLDQFTGEGFRQLAKHLQFAAEQGHKVLAFVSSSPGAGRTSVLLTLTRILALEGKTAALLIDADRRHPQLASVIGQDRAEGLREVLHGQLPIEQAIVPMTPGGVSVLPLNETVTDAEWLKLVAPLRVLLKHARHEYDMILVDAGVQGPETRMADCWLRGSVDAVITISRQLTGKVTEHEVLDWKQIGIESLGVIETFA